MATMPSAPPFLAERTDIHKSCKAIESLLIILDNYNQVASAMVTLEKKLAKAMRELASSKVTGDIAANAFNTSAILFEALADVSAKFAKITDKEYDGIGAEVRKWFRRLAREEKAHDERLSNANAKIKQASQAYEKRSKKNPRDSAEEHARYINLVSILGPEISKDKYDHGISITRQHILTTYGVAACLARLADAEWVRVCESLRRFSPNIGPLGEWRALCEGQWERPLPRELPDIDTTETNRDILGSGWRVVTDYLKWDSQQGQSIEHPEQLNNAYNFSTESDSNLGRPLSQSGNTTNTYTRQDNLTNASTSASSGQDPSNQSADSSPLRVDPNTGSVRSLSAFPHPPTHFPIPPPRSVTFQPTPSGLNPNNSTPIMLSQDEDTDELLAPNIATTRGAPPNSSPISRRIPPSLEYSSEIPTSENAEKVAELGIAGSNDSSSYVAAMRHRYTNGPGTVSPQPKDIPRLPTRVADLATRYQPLESPPSASRFRRPSLLVRQQNNNVVSASQNENLPHFQDAREESGQGTEATSAHRLELKERERQLLERERELALKAKEIEQQREEVVKARQNITKQPPAPSGLSAFAQQLIPHSRERKISLHRQQQQQLEPLSLPNRIDCIGSPSSPTRHSYHSSLNSPQGPVPLTLSSSSAGQGHHLLHSQQSQQSFISTSPLAQSTHSSLSQPPSPTLVRSQDANHTVHDVDTEMSSSPPVQHRPQSKGQHPSYCGCELCTSKYGEPSNPAPSPYTLRPLEQAITLRSGTANSRGVSKGSGVSEKLKGGWMRRLSMPIVMSHALNLDPSPKKSYREGRIANSSYALGAGIGNTPLPNRPQSRGGLFSLDGKRNASATNLRLGGGAGVLLQEDGKWGGYEAGLGGNRSMTNLGLSGKR
ncbi:hypothetical protein AX15_004572 [Amanita polypyramis BW_CC]|nr:hypothetical protein AX15_004572 [Amanita polypyramis BW_CC]